VLDPGLTGKVVLVTGANNPAGIGASIAEAFAAQGAGVFITYLRQAPQAFGVDAGEAAAATVPGEAFYRACNAAPPDAVLDRLRAHGGGVGSAEVDLADPAGIPRLFDLVEAALGPVDVLVNNAAYCLPDTLLPSDGAEAAAHAFGERPSHTVTAESHDRHFAVNARAPALAMAEFGRRHARRGANWGRIVNVSTDGARGFAGEVSYGASKLALESYSRAAAIEFARFGITVNLVSLGPIQTGWIAPEFADQVARDIPLGRLGAPADVADVVLFFASDQARWVTGQVLFVGGGHAM
jgi:3-oxoacyl-[acyl-carrier protein] reductase